MGLVGAAVIGALGSIAGGFMGKSEQEKANEANAEQARLNREFQERMSSTAYQRGVKDMQAAGLNPALAYEQGGASAPSGAQANIQPSTALASGVSTAAQMAANVSLTRAQAEKTMAEAAVAKTEAYNRSRVINADINVKSTSAASAAAAASLAERQLFELENTWEHRKDLPKFQAAIEELRMIVEKGTSQEKIAAAELTNKLMQSNIDINSPKADVMAFLHTVLTGNVGSALEASDRFKRILKLVFPNSRFD